MDIENRNLIKTLNDIIDDYDRTILKDDEFVLQQLPLEISLPQLEQLMRNPYAE